MTHKILRISGPDAQTFLQGQLTCDVQAITDTTCHLGAHCNRQGRMISLFNLFLHQDQYYLIMPARMLLITQHALKKYAPFFKVAMEVVLATDIPTPPLPYPTMPNLHPATSAKFLPHEFGLQQTHAISFTKGCYTGQEIIARMQYRGALKTHLYQTTLKETLSLTPGDAFLGGTLVDQREKTIWLICHESDALGHDELTLFNPATLG